MKVLFMGTPDFAVPCLKRLIDENYEIVGVITQPDKPKGRGYTLTPPPVKVCALENGFKVFQPETLKNEALKSLLDELKPDIIIVVAYGKILPDYILNYPKFGCINIHASLLPKYRGAAPIQWSIINGESETGITSMYMNSGLDTGDMILKSKVKITEKMTGGELHDLLSETGAENLSETLKLIKEGKAVRTEQNDSEATYAPMLNKEVCKINFEDKANNIYNKIRALNPFPAAYFTLNGRIIKVLDAEVLNEYGKNHSPGEVLDNKEFTVACSDKAIKLLKIKPEGKKEMDASEFLRGNKIEKNFIIRKDD